jgi:hypothetical protein
MCGICGTTRPRESVSGIWHSQRIFALTMFGLRVREYGVSL